MTENCSHPMKVHNSDFNAVPFVMERFVESRVMGRALGVLLGTTIKGIESVVKGFMESHVRGILGVNCK